VADPVVTLLVSGTSTLATVTVSFTAQTTGTLLVLSYTGDNYLATSGSGRPESTGWTKIRENQHNAGHAMWYRISDGTETSVQYTMTGSGASSHLLHGATNIDGTTPLDTSNLTSTTSSVTTQASGTITPAAGRKLLMVSISGCRFSGSGVSVSSWTNGYTESGDVTGTVGSTTDTTANAYLVADGGTSTSTTATYSGTSIGGGGIIASFNNAAAASNFGPPIRRNPSRGLTMRGRR
jgi:hypothetical protein